MNRIIAVLAAFVATAGVASATHCRQQIVVPAQVIASQLIAPSYFPIQGQQQQQNNDVLLRILETLERIEARMAGGGDPLSFEAIAAQDCKSCHQAGKNPRKDFVLFDEAGKSVFDQLSLQDKKIMKLRVETTDPQQVMPPSKPLSDVRKRAVVEALSK